MTAFRSTVLLLLVATVSAALACGCGAKNAEPVTRSDGAIALRDGRLDEAVSLLSETAAERPEDGTAFYLLGVANWQLRRWDDAAEAFKTASTLMSDDVRSREFYAECLGHLGEWKKAVGVLKGAEELAPKSITVITALGVARLKTRDVQGAHDDFLKALQIEPEYAPAIFNIAYLNYKWLKKDTVARQYFDDYLAAGGDAAHEKLVNRALQDIADKRAKTAEKIALAEAKRVAKAEAERKRREDEAAARRRAEEAAPGEAVAEPPPVRQKPQRDVAVRETRAGLQLCKAGKWPEAAERFRRAIAADSSYDIAYHNLGLAYNEIGDLNAAVASFRETLKLSPGKKTARYALALVLWKNGDSSGAVRELDTLLRADPTYAKAHYLMGSIYEKLGSNKSKTRSHYARYLRLEPAGKRATHARKWLGKNPKKPAAPIAAPVAL